jgi:hydrogenase assembly chaperone HypC/HupF
VIVMCLGFPGLVVAVDPAGATIDTEGRRRRASTLLAPDLQAGEWVFVAAGTVVDRLDPEEAAFIRAHLISAGALEPAGASDDPSPAEDRHDDHR